MEADRLGAETFGAVGSATLVTAWIRYLLENLRV